MSNAYSSLRKFYSRHCVGFTHGKSSMLHILLCYCGFTFYTLLSVIITQHFLQCNDGLLKTLVSALHSGIIWVDVTSPSVVSEQFKLLC